MMFKWKILRETVYSSQIELLHAVELKAKVCGFAVAGKNSNKRSVYLQCMHGQENKDRMQAGRAS